MNHNPSLPFDNRPVVLLFANPSGLSVSLAETLLSNFCRVQIISSDKKSWEDALHHLSDNRAVTIHDSSETLSLESFEYVLMVDRGLGTVPGVDRNLTSIKRLIKKNPVNTLFVVPYLQYSKGQRILADKVREFYKKTKDNSGMVYVGQTLGTRIILDDKDLLSKIVKDAIVKGQINVPSGDTVIFPVHVAAAAKEIVRLLFSFGGVGQESLVVGHKTNVGEAVRLCKKYVSPLEVKYTKEDWDTSLPSVAERRLLSLDLNQSLKETFEWYSSHPPEGVFEKKVREQKKKVPKKKSRKLDLSRIELPQLDSFPKPAFRSFSLINKKTTIASSLVVVFFILPYFLLALGGASLVLAKKSLMGGKTTYASLATSAAAVSARTSKAELSFLTAIPFVGGVFEDAKKTSSLIEDASGLARRAVEITVMSNEFLVKILGEKEYDASSYSEPLSLELESLYRDLSFLESEYGEGKGLSGWAFDKGISGLDLEELRSKILPAQRITKEAPTLLGVGSKKKYLVLFQNNMELRPTGGFIGSFALATFDGGRLIDISVQDVYSADGQLKGHVEPPEPIRQYLGEANWFLRDSNWDPDFPVSAQRAEWFLDKELGEAVDGVISIDLEFAKSLVGVSGPIYLEDFDKEITKDNLYEVTQYEVEKDFFPGSRKKANFLTSLTRELLNQLLNVKEGKHLETGLAMVDSLEKKHIQVFLHNINAQRAIADLGWSGAVYQPVCVGNCFADYLGIVEANLGVNKANYFVKRSASLGVEIGERRVTHTLTVNIENTANSALGDKGVYENYIRVLSPQDAIFSEIAIKGPNSEELLPPEIEEVRGRKEAGALVKIAPGQKRSIVFTWEAPASLSFDASGQYRLVWRKQAGTVSDPIEVLIVGEFGQKSLGIPTASLTEAGAYRYNTELAEDFAPRIFW